MTNRYILQKDILNFSTGHVIPAGEIFEPIENHDYYSSKNGWNMCQLALKNTDFFKEDKPERIEVRVFRYLEKTQSGCPSFDFHVTAKSIPEHKFPLIKEAIEKVLNDEIWYLHSEHPISIEVKIQEKEISPILNQVREFKEKEVKECHFETASEWRRVERFLKGEITV